MEDIEVVGESGDDLVAVWNFDGDGVDSQLLINMWCVN